jgi:Protein of unknown function (DUF3631)/Domain of unknown function (DUF3854)
MDVPESMHAVPYLIQRGINLDTARALGMEILVGNSHPPGTYKSRLGFDIWRNGIPLSRIVKEGIWFSCVDAKGKVQSSWLRVFPELRGKEGEIVKVLTTKKGGFPFIPPAVWDVATKPGHPLFFTEGAIKAVSIFQVGELPIGLTGVWSAVSNDEFTGTDIVPVLKDGFEWRCRQVYLAFDQDFVTNPSVRQALIRTLIVLIGYGAEPAVMRWPLEEGKGIDDFLFAKSNGEVELPKVFEEVRKAAVPFAGILKPIDLERVELELCRSQLKGPALEQTCRLAAKPLGVGSRTLLEEVIHARAKFVIGTPKPPPNIVPRAPAEILGSIIEVLNRYIVFLFPEEQPSVIALWVIHTWLFRGFDYTPYLFVYSPTIRSGKTRLFEVLKMLCRNTELTEGATAAALIRIIDEPNPPTFLLDEMDTVYSARRRSNEPEAESMRRFLNAGFKRGATFLRCVFKGKEILTQKFPAFCPKAVAAIGRCLPNSVADRSIPIELARQGRRKRAQKMRDRELLTSVGSLRDELEVLSLDEELIKKLNEARPEMPDQLNDRQQDICEPLLAIANLAGGEWSKKARDALIKLFGHEEEEADLSVRLLADIKRVFDRKGVEALSTEWLLEGLISDADDAPWPDMFEKLLQNDNLRSAGSKLARLLKPYHIKSTTVRVGEETPKGYYRDQFKSAWERYLPESSSVSPTSERNNATNSPKPITENNLECCVSTDSDPLCGVITQQGKSLTEK